MRIVDIVGEYTANDIKELEAILLRRFENDANSFYLSHDDQQYPTLSVLVKGSVAALGFLEREEEPGLRSIGSLSELDPREDTVFPISPYRGDDLEVENNALVPFSSALDAAKEFFVSAKPPQCIDWLEL